ncbi:tyrosine-protein phosphatase [Lactobacillus xujianguonis]|uniref:Tyrosine-protein phosphatase n=1 Tax=Lactobacillus xujianguonis TaxID=2495899 RepID=A0A437SU31_9LACO|nr:tyrosine-protein phosphatase [Lactobacillus xujianguonis]RVU70449.1 tyrosine-protein phosphatase [Lactobacillus xujianguonis]RVU73148.1 tyrosine-protein phosphatase [Lactobacillus xujianguonis]
MLKPLVLPLKSVRNPRDLGGYVGFDGRKIKARRLLRTGNIANISEADKQYLQAYGLNQIIDLRSPLEIKRNPDQEITGVKHYLLSISDEDNTNGGKKDLTRTFQRYREDQYAGFHMMCQRYHDHVAREHAQKTLHQILELLANNHEGATLYHCSEGKDRTGIVTIVLLYILGVDLETIRQDYLFSNPMLDSYRAKRDQRFAANGENLKFRANMRVLGSVSNSFFDTALITVKEKFGSLDDYLREQLGVTPDLRDALRELYLEKK